MSRTLAARCCALVALLLSLAAPTARAECVPNPVPNEPPICESLTPPPVDTGVLSRGGKLVLPPGSGQAGGGPGFDAVTGRLGLPVSGAWGLSDRLEVGGSFAMVLTPAPWNTQFRTWLGQMFVSNLALYGRYSIVPKQLAISGRMTFLGPLTGKPYLSPMLLQVESPYTTELAPGVRLYWVNGLAMIGAGGVQAQLSTSGTFMFSITDLVYAQALLGTGLGASANGPTLPYVDQPILAGTGAGMVTGENEGIGLALTAALAQPVAIVPGQTTGVLSSLGVLATYVKAI